MGCAPIDGAIAREQVKRLLQSDVLRGSEGQRRLLQYLAEKSLEGTACQLKEYIVGVEALGKPESYDPRQDPSVRILAGKLRLKLEAYYRTEGAAEPVRIDFPKGSFQLLFRPAPETASATGEAGATRRWRRWATALGAVLVVSIAVAVWAGARLIRLEGRVGHARAWTAELEQIWGPFLTAQRPVLLCLGVPLFVEIRDTGMFRATSINDWPAMQDSPLFAKISRLFPGQARPMHTYTGVGEAVGAFEIGHLLGTHQQDIVVTRSNVLSWEELAGSNAIFLGPPKFVAHLKDIPLEQELVVDSDKDLIRNLRPRNGEPQTLPDQVGSDESVTHALISRLPNLHGRGEVFIFASNFTGGTLGAVQYATEPDYAADLVRRVRLPSGKMPANYQIVVRVQLQKLYPVKISYLFHHVLKR